jgi:predicted aminopeptidase
MVLALAVSAGHGGCYYLHLASGQWRVLRASHPIDELLADPATPEALRGQLELVLETRRFATELGLEVSEQYTSYVPWPGDRIVTSLVVTRPGEIEPAPFHFPVVGDVPYKGFFERERAEAEAAELRAQGLDVCEVPVPAYSTLGWLADPVTDPMLRYGDTYLVETLIHELVHATVFFADAADFNEGIATFIGQEGTVEFFAARGQGERARALVEDERRVSEAQLALRQAIGELYAGTPPGPGRDAQRAAFEAETRTELSALPLRELDAAAVAAQARLNDACLSISATYAADVPAYAARLADLGGDLRRFVALTVSAAEAEDPRAAILGARAPAPASSRRGGAHAEVGGVLDVVRRR